VNKGHWPIPVTCFQVGGHHHGVFVNLSLQDGQQILFIFLGLCRALFQLRGGTFKEAYRFDDEPANGRLVTAHRRAAIFCGDTPSALQAGILAFSSTVSFQFFVSFCLHRSLNFENRILNYFLDKN
jgi:hypothetical protein